jgi:Fe-S oxidoreductase
MLPARAKSELGLTCHVACHQRMHNAGQKSRELLALIPDSEVTLIER